MGYNVSIKSTENLTKAVMSLHKYFDFFVQCLNPMITIINGSIRSKNKGNRDKPTKFNANNIH